MFTYLPYSFLSLVLGNCVCNTETCAPSRNCSYDGQDGYCVLDLHIDETTQHPLSIEQTCHIADGFVLLPCSETEVEEVDKDLLRTCCCGFMCNLCPLQPLLDKVPAQYLPDLYKLFPDECQPNSSSSSILPHTFSTSLFAHLSNDHSLTTSFSGTYIPLNVTPIVIIVYPRTSLFGCMHTDNFSDFPCSRWLINMAIHHICH